MKRTLAVAGVAAVLSLAGAVPARAIGADCAAARSRAASAQPNSPAHLRAADEAAACTATGQTVASVPAASRRALGAVETQQMDHLDRLLAGVTKGSPAHFRLIEERDKLTLG